MIYSFTKNLPSLEPRRSPAAEAPWVEAMVWWCQSLHHDMRVWTEWWSGECHSATCCTHCCEHCGMQLTCTWWRGRPCLPPAPTGIPCILSSPSSAFQDSTWKCQSLSRSRGDWRWEGGQLDPVSDDQTYLYAAGRHAKGIGQEEEAEQGAWWKWALQESDKEGCDPNSDRNFTLAALDSQSFMRNITLWIIPAAICTRLNAAANKGAIIFGHCASLQKTSFISSDKRDQTKHRIKPADYAKLLRPFSRVAATAPNAARACLPYLPPSQAQRWLPALTCLSALWPTWGPSWVLNFTLRR